MNKHGLILEGLRHISEGTDPKKGAQTLLKDVQSKLKSNENRTVKLKGVGNLSTSDLETLELYAQTFLKSGSFSGLMEPRGSIKEVLMKYGVMEGTIVEAKSDWVIKFYDGSTLLTSWSHTKAECEKEIKRLRTMSVQDINKELGLNKDLSVSFIYLQNSKGKEEDVIKL